MPTSTGADRYSRMETFLDNVERVDDPMRLEEPFRSLWLRIHGDMPTLMSEDDMKVMISRGFSGSGLSGVEIESSKGIKIDEKGGSSIEVVSPDEVGPTLEMKVEDKKVKFKAAGEDDIKALKSKEDAAQKVVSVQKLTSTLKGIGGDAAKVIEGVRNIAISYRDGMYENVVSQAKDIEGKMDSDDLKKSIVVQLQKKISEYEEIGGDLTMAKERFKELAGSLKDGRDDFYPLAQSTNKMAEDAIKDIVTIEEVEIAEPAQIKKEEPTSPKEEEKPKLIKRKVVRKKPELPGEADEEAEPQQVEIEPKPVIKIIKKQVVVLKTADDEDEEEDEFSLDLDDDEIDVDEGPKVELDTDIEDEPEPEPKVEKEVQPQTEVPETVGSQAVEKRAETAPIPEPEVKKEQDAPVQKEKPSEPVKEAPVKKEAAPSGPAKEEIEAAFKQYQFVYNAAVKLHSSGKDVTQIFDLYSFGESSRQKGDMKTYVGVGKQLQDMLIALQK